MSTLNEKCAVFGVYGKGLDVSRLSFFGLFALQHRGQESSGIAAADGHRVKCFKNAGLVSHVYNEEVIESLKGHIAIGHNRYSTFGGLGVLHAQPWVVDARVGHTMGGIRAENGLLALAHNGNLPSVTALLDFCKDKGILTEDLNDSELMAEVIGYYMKQGKPVEEAVKAAYPLFTGSFSLLIATKDTLVAVRDECGIRPLAIGKLNGGVIFASETCAFHAIGAEFVREVKPGEMVVVDEGGTRAFQVALPRPKLDLFEMVYFARPDSKLLGKSVYEVRLNCGIRLAKESPVKADVVVPVPETAIPTALGYSQATGIPLQTALIKNRYIHRTFIQPEQHARDLGVKMKLTPLPEMIKDKRVAVIDDSIVRGTTSRQIVKMLFEAGAKEVHFLVSSPPVKYPDFYGIDTPRQEDLIASRMTVKQIGEFLGANSLHYLSLDGLIESTGLKRDVFNTSCFTGEYPINLHERAKDFHAPVEG